MATILLSAAGAAIGSGFGGSVLGLSGAVIGRTVGAAVGRSIDQRILGSGSDAVEVGRVDRFRVSGVGYGTPIQEVWGRARVAGQIIWASRFMQFVRTSGGGKGTPRPAVETFSYSVSLAIGICRGEASSIGRVWADGVEIARNSLNMRFYPGNQDQLPDPKIEAVEGIGLAPSYRGLCYIVIENLALSRFGNRVPQFSFEVIRPAMGDGAEQFKNIQRSVNAVALIPGSGEYALATSPVHFDLGPGRIRSANVHSIQGITDFQLSLRQLNEELPNCKSVSLVVSWFGNDLRCGQCVIQPKVEQNLQDAVGMPWSVSGATRFDATVVPSVDGRPIYGGTPSDQSVIEAIRAIRAAGKEVMFYPFILMDQLTGNNLSDPWSDASHQPALPWRGRITLSRAPGRDGSPDQTNDAALEVGAFLGDAAPSDFVTTEDGVQFTETNNWGYRRFILHYAHLCVLAGGVDAFCVGSELRGMTQVRSSASSFPMVDALCQLAGEVKEILGDGTAVSYAADWSEYFGYHTGNDVYFNLDPLWSNDNIDFIGIDNYMPLSDWRDGFDHADADWGSIYNIDYLLANIDGGEGFDWFYDSYEGQEFQKRRRIEDLEFGEDWVFRFKDIRGWWSNEHHERFQGVRSPTPTSWQAGMKPIRFTEYGCAAINKATNEPNKFLDSKSSESVLPRASNGQRDDLIQMQYLQAMAKYWNDDLTNPLASSFSGRMVDFDRSHVWAWDARPFPEFPGNLGEWSDGINYDRGHWINGRSSNQQLPAVISEMLSNTGVQVNYDVTKAHGLVRGTSDDGSGTARSRLQSLCMAYSIDAAEIEGKIHFFERRNAPFQDVDVTESIVSSDAGGDRLQIRKTIDIDVGRTRLSYIEAENDFDIRTVEAAFPDSSSNLVSDSECDLLLIESEARSIAERWLAEGRVSGNSLRLSLSRSAIGLNSGDVISFFGVSFRINSIEDSNSLLIDACRIDYGAYVSGMDTVGAPARVSPVPGGSIFARFLDLPLLLGSENPNAPYVAVASSPWPGPFGVWSSVSDSGYSLNVTVDAPAILGVLTTELMLAPTGIWDRGSLIQVEISSGELSSVSMQDVLNGANVAAIGDGSPENWEIVQFVNAELVAPDIYKLSLLLRGLAGTDGVRRSSWPPGSLFVVIDDRLPQIDLVPAARGLDRFYRIGSLDGGFSDPSVLSEELAFNGIGLRPYSVSHLSTSRESSGDILVSWIRRTRIDGDSWQSFEVPLGEESESYSVRVLSGALTIRESITGGPTWIYTEAMQLADGVGSGFRISVAQVSASFGLGPIAVIDAMP